MFELLKGTYERVECVYEQFRREFDDGDGLDDGESGSESCDKSEESSDGDEEMEEMKKIDGTAEATDSNNANEDKKWTSRES